MTLKVGALGLVEPSASGRFTEGLLLRRLTAMVDPVAMVFTLDSTTINSNSVRAILERKVVEIASAERGPSGGAI